MFNYNPKAPYRDYLVKSDEPDPTWYFYSRPTKQLYDRYKLHICILPSDFAAVQNQIHHILHMALKAHWIAGYKTLDVNLAIELNPLTSNPEALRAMHNPFVIYLNDNYDSENLLNIVRMCYDIEDILLKFPLKGNLFHAPCDLPLIDHFIFRQAYLNADIAKNHYIKAFDERYTEQLAQEGRASTFYREFYKLWMKEYPSSVEVKQEGSSSDKMNFSPSENKKTGINFLGKSPHTAPKGETPTNAPGEIRKEPTLRRN